MKVNGSRELIAFNPANPIISLRLRKMFEHRCTVDEERLKVLESQLKEARNTVEEADKKCDEVSIKHLLSSRRINNFKCH